MRETASTQPSNRPRVSAWVILSTALSMALLTGCTEVRIPPSDATPPIAKLTLFTEDVMVTSNGTAATVHVDEYDSFTLMVAGTDEDGGVREVWIEGSMTTVCEDGGPGVRRDSTLRYPTDIDRHPVEAEVGDIVKRTIIDATNWAMRDYLAGCPDGSFSLQATYNGVAENFHGQVARTAPLTLIYP